MKTSLSFIRALVVAALLATAAGTVAAQEPSSAGVAAPAPASAATGPRLPYDWRTISVEHRSESANYRATHTIALSTLALVLIVVLLVLLIV